MTARMLETFEVVRDAYHCKTLAITTLNTTDYYIPPERKWSLGIWLYGHTIQMDIHHHTNQTRETDTDRQKDRQTETFITINQMRERGGGGGGESCLFVGCLTSQQHESVFQGRICSDNFTCYHTEIEVADQTFHLTQSQHTDTGPTSPITDPVMPGAWQGSHWSDNF